MEQNQKKSRNLVYQLNRRKNENNQREFYTKNHRKW